MDRFYIITNSDKDKKLEITEKIRRLSENTSQKLVKYSRQKGNNEGSFHYTDPDKVPDDTQ